MTERIVAGTVFDVPGPPFPFAPTFTAPATIATGTVGAKFVVPTYGYRHLAAAIHFSQIGTGTGSMTANMTAQPCFDASGSVPNGTVFTLAMTGGSTGSATGMLDATPTALFQSLSISLINVGAEPIVPTLSILLQ
jgi:hypothetical protein